jgi:hypothetical protein
MDFLYMESDSDALIGHKENKEKFIIVSPILNDRIKEILREKKLKRILGE